MNIKKHLPQGPNSSFPMERTAGHLQYPPLLRRYVALTNS